LGAALRASEEPLRAAFLAGAERLWRDSFSRQIENVGSKDHLVTHRGPEFQRSLRACGWWTIDRDKLKRSAADYWVFVLQGFANRSVDFVVVPPRDLLQRLQRIHGRHRRYQSYLWVAEKKRCWESRDLKRRDQLLIVLGEYADRSRDFTHWLNAWSPVARLNR
jgi:hypothetical protein